MIQRTIPTWQALDWQEELKSLIQDPEQLLTELDLDPALLPAALSAAKRFPLRLTRSFLSRIEKGNINDPLLKQVLPLGLELEEHPNFSPDPLDEASYNPIPGVVHKYENRVLLIDTTSCAINCRYCFRREFDYSANRLSEQDWEAIYAYLTKDTAIDEVIFSGGDPLLQSDRHFASVLQRLAAIPHLARVRVHSRIPIVLPTRVSESLLQIFSQSRLQSIWVVHCNHAQELDKHVIDAFRAIRKANITLLNQAVLLQGVNDNAEVQITLAKSLFEAGVQPYYLHVLDKVSGTTHFDVDISYTKQIYETMRSKLAGYMLPRLVREQAGASAKTPII